MKALLCLTAVTLAAQVPFQIPIRALEFSSGSQIALYAGTTVGLYRSTDDGATWSPVALRPLGENQPGIASIAAAPRLLLAGESGSPTVWRSTDNGATWEPVAIAAASGFRVARLVIAAGTAYAILGRDFTSVGAAQSEVYKTTDGGARWSRVYDWSGPANTLFIHLGDSRIHYRVDPRSLYRSNDEGSSWTRVGGPNVQTDNLSGLVTVASSPSNANTVVVGGNGANPAVHRIWSSNDGGVNWQVAYSRPTNAFHVFNLRPNELRAGITTPGLEYHVLGEGGQWRSATIERSPSGSVWAIALDPRNSRVFVGTTQGVYSTTDERTFTRVGTYQPTLSLGRPSLELTMLAGLGLTPSVSLPFSVIEDSRQRVPLTFEPPTESWMSFGTPPMTSGAALAVRFDVGSLPPGEYKTNIRVRSPSTFNSTVDIPVTVNLTAASNTPYALIGTPTPAAASVTSIAWDPRGEAIVVEQSSRILRVRSSGERTVLAGDGAAALTDGVDARQADLTADIGGVAVSPSGDIYFHEAIRGIVWRLDAEGKLRRFAGTRDTFTYRDNAVANTVYLPIIRAMAFGGSGALWIAGLSNLYRISTDGRVTQQEKPPGPLSGFAIDTNGDLILAAGDQVWRVSPQGVRTLLAGNGTAGFNGDGPAATVRLDEPTDIVVGRDGAVYLFDSGNARVRLVRSGQVSTIAGVGATAADRSDFTTCRPGSLAPLSSVRSLAVTPAGDLLILQSEQLTRVRQPVAGDAASLEDWKLVNAATGQAVLAPGSLFRATATALGTDPLVCVNNRPVAILSADSSILGQIPFEIETGTARGIVFSSSGAASEVEIRPVASGLFVENERVVGVEAPVRAGAEIAVLVTGQGQTDPKLATGAAAPADAAVIPAASVTAKIGVEPAKVLKAQMVPGRVGVLQVTIEVPALEPGDYPLSISIGEVESNSGLITIGRE